jgi:hypothetical protein
MDIDPGRWCGECRILACTPGDYLCKHCRLDDGAHIVQWWMNGAMKGVYAEVYFLSNYEGKNYVCETKPPHRVYAVGPTGIKR